MPQHILLEFGEAIWQVLPDCDGSRLALLTYSEGRRGTVRCVDLETGTVRGELGPDFAWHHLAVFQQGVLVMDALEQGALPVSRGLCAYDMDSGACLWELTGYRHVGVTNDGLLLGSALDPDAPHVIVDIRSGIVRELKEAGEMDASKSAARDWHARQSMAIRSPQIVLRDDTLFVELREKLGFETESAVFHSMLPEGGEACAWHTGIPGAFNLQLAWFNRAGGLEDCLLERASPSMNPEPFFVLGHWLLAVQERTRLMVARV